MCENNNNYNFIKIFDSLNTKDDSFSSKLDKIQKKLKPINYLIKLTLFNKIVDISNDSLILGCKCMIPMHKSCLIKLIIFSQNLCCQQCNVSFIFKDNDKYNFCEKVKILEATSSLICYLLLNIGILCLILVFIYLGIIYFRSLNLYSFWIVIILFILSAMLIGFMIKFFSIIRSIDNKKFAKSLDINEFNGISGLASPECFEQIQTSAEILNNFLYMKFRIELDDLIDFKLINKFYLEKKSSSSLLRKYIFIEDNYNQNKNNNSNFSSLNSFEESINRIDINEKEKIKLIRINSKISSEDSLKQINKSVKSKSDKDPKASIKTYISDSPPPKFYIREHSDYIINDINHSPVNPILLHDPNNLHTTPQRKSMKRLDEATYSAFRKEDLKSLTTRSAENKRPDKYLLKNQNLLTNKTKLPKLKLNKNNKGKGTKSNSNKYLKNLSTLRRPSGVELLAMKYMRDVNRIEEEKFKETPDNSCNQSSFKNSIKPIGSIERENRRQSKNSNSLFKVPTILLNSPVKEDNKEYIISDIDFKYRNNDLKTEKSSADTHKTNSYHKNKFDEMILNDNHKNTKNNNIDYMNDLNDMEYMDDGYNINKGYKNFKKLRSRTLEVKDNEKIIINNNNRIKSYKHNNGKYY